MKPRIALLVLLVSIAAFGQTANTIAPLDTIEPADLVKLLPKKPLILNVGPKTLFAQAHIPTAEYIGMTYEPTGIKALDDRVQKVPKKTLIVLYCGCCPWDRCPNMAPAMAEMKKLGFTNIKALHIAQNFGANWVYAGYPTTSATATAPAK